MQSKTIISKGLMAFVLVSIGFAVGKEMTLRRIAQNDADTRGAAGVSSSDQADRTQDKVVVTYMHGTFRCITCNSIESMAKEVVETEFAQALADGRLQWRSVNFQENTALGRRYGVAVATVVLVRMQDGQEVDFERLDEVWTKLNDPVAFNQYIESSIRAYLDEVSL